MIINNVSKLKLKILLDKVDLENKNITTLNFLTNPLEYFEILFEDFEIYKKIDIKSIKEFNIYSFKFITFYIIIEF